MKFATTLVCAALLALAPGSGRAKETPSIRKSILKPIHFVEYDLPNGLHVILHENHAAPVVATYVLYHVGSKNERPDRTGFAHFFEHLMFEGSENIPRGQIDKYVSGAGGNLNASTSFDQTDYYLNLPANQLKLALWIESERMLHAKIDETGVENAAQSGERGEAAQLRQPALWDACRRTGETRLRRNALRMGADRQLPIYRSGVDQ
jgi:hypothetical protein